MGSAFVKFHPENFEEADHWDIDLHNDPPPQPPSPRPVAGAAGGDGG